MRGNPPNRILRVRTEDGGVHWSTPVKTALPNPNAAIGSVAAFRRPLLLVFNNAEEDRENLSLARSTDFGKHVANRAQVRGRFRIDAGAGPGIFLPMDHAGRAGDVHVLYTWVVHG